MYKVLEYGAHHLGNVRPELISLEQAQRLYRKNEYYREYIPQRFISEFRNETGLEEAFFGGEVSFSRLREFRENNTYCKLGDSYIGIRGERDTHYNTYQVLVVTRRTPQAFRPVSLFESIIGTFHATWLEKLIADNDTTFVKPSVPKELKPYQFNGYYAVEKVGEVDGVAIYANELLDERVFYTARPGMELKIKDSLSALKNEIQSSRVTGKGEAA